MQRKVKLRRFAQGTKVDVGKSRMELESMLTKHGAVQVIIGYDVSGAGFVHFALDGRQYRLNLPPRADKRNHDQIERERWRSLVLVLKAKLEVVASELVSPEQEFLAYLVLPNGKALGAHFAPEIETIYKSGKMPKMLPEG